MPGWWPAQTPKSSYLGEIKRFCFVVACPNPKIVLSRRDKATLLCGGLPKPQNRPISARQGDFALWWPAQAQKSSYLGEIKRFCFVLACPSKSSYLGEIRRFCVVVAQTPKSSYLGEIRRFWRFCFVVACPNLKIVLSRRETAILLCGGLPKPQNRPISARQGDFALWWPAQTPKSSSLCGIRRFCFAVACPNPTSSYLGEIRRFCFVVACPNPRIVLSRRDKAILLPAQTPKSSHLGEIR